MDLYDGIHETWARANWTQLTGAVYYNNQQQLAFHRPRCADLEMNAIECLEAYGAHRGRLICEDYLTDMLECMYHHKQNQRAREMKKERFRQLLRGERKFTEFYAKKPPRDGWQPGPFI